jgi:hypothetical protein
MPIINPVPPSDDDVPPSTATYFGGTTIHEKQKASWLDELYHTI